MINIFKFVGVLGIILISIGILLKNREQQDIFYICGGVFLGTYSIYSKDLIFISVQAIFTIAGIYDLVNLKFFKK